MENPRLNEDTATGELKDHGIDCSGAGGGEYEVPDQMESVEMPSQAGDGDEVPVDRECSGAAGDGSQDLPADGMECSGAAGEIGMPIQSQTVHYSKSLPNVMKHGLKVQKFFTD